MANEINGVINYKDSSGTVNEIYPITKIGNVEGLESTLNSKVSTQSGYGLISDADKAQIQTNKANITAAETAIAAKASQTEVNQIKADVETKASSTTVTQLQSDMAVQTARMDQLVGTVPVGSSDEIADARVMADGKVANNLGDAIRTQASTLNDLWKNIGRSFDYEASESARSIVEFVDITGIPNIKVRFSGTSKAATVHITNERSINSDNRIKTFTNLQRDTLYNISTGNPEGTAYAAIYIADEKSQFTLKYDVYTGVVADTAVRIAETETKLATVKNNSDEIYNNYGEVRTYPAADVARDIINYREISDDNDYVVKYSGISKNATIYFAKSRSINSDERVHSISVYPDTEYKVSKELITSAKYCILRIASISEPFTLVFNIESGVICDVREDLLKNSDAISARIDGIDSEIGEVRTYDFTERTSPVDVNNYRLLPEKHTDCILKFTGIEMTGTVYFTRARTINSVDRVYVLNNVSPGVEYLVPKELFEGALYCVLGIKSVPHGSVYVLDFDVRCGEISNIYNDIAELKANGLNDLPEYMIEYMDEKDKAIDAKMNILLTGDAFVFITDNHVQRNTLNSFKCTKDILKKTSLDKVFYNGDCVAAYGDAEVIESCAKINRDNFNSLKPYGMVFLGRGNHDFAIKGSQGSDIGVTRDNKYAYNMLTKCQEAYAHTYPGKCYYYYDNTNQKIRYIGVDTQEKLLSPTTPWGVKYEVSEEQIRWLCDTALAVEDGWSVVVIGHVPIDTKMNAYDSAMANLSTILQAYKNKTNCSFKDFRNAKGEFVAYFTGHNHVDESFVTNGVLSISTTSDAQYSDGGYDRSTGTTNEVAFDVMIVDTENRTINAIRIGAGNNRQWTY